MHMQLATRACSFSGTAADPGRRVVGAADLAVQNSKYDESDGFHFTMGMGAALFLAIWVVMMVAMMFPATAPDEPDFRAGPAWKGTAAGVPLSPTWVFVGAYLLIWTLFGVLAYLGANAASELAQQMPWLMLNAARIGGGILVLAGIYQFTPLKRVCLAKCCMPQHFLLDGWRDGRVGAFRMGLSHGLYCLGANWLLFVLLFVLGLMNIAAMAVLTVLIFAEKVFPQAERIAWIAGLALMLYGTLVIVVPAALLLNGAGM